MRKPRRLPIDQLAPFEWTLPDAYHVGWSQRVPSQAPPPQTIDWPSLFGNHHPVELEIGFGKGLFLLESALTRPETNFFGIEIIRKYQLYATNRIARRRLANVKTCWGDAKTVVRLFIATASLQAVHILFPDPWWKTRHKKRLLLTADFVEEITRVLIPDGRLHFVTDVADYFSMVQGLLRNTQGLQELPPPIAHEPRHDMDYLSNFERKFRKAGKPIYRSLYAKGMA